MAYLPLSTANLPDPVIDPAQGASPEDYFNAVLYTGNGGTSRSITGMGFQADFLWHKDRSAARNHSLVDVIRGTNDVQSNATTAERSMPSFVSFDSDGFTVTQDGSTNPNWNENSITKVVWGWKANGSGVSNTDGSITSTVSANTTSGFSVVKYTGNNTRGATIGHGLSQVPEFVAVKNLDDGVENWACFHKDLAGTFPSIKLNTSDPTVTSADGVVIRGSEFTSSVISVGENPTCNGNGNGHIAYCFHSVDGFSKFGSFSGNNSTDGPFIYLGFRPALFMVKCTNTTGSWYCYDTARLNYNVMGSQGQPIAWDTTAGEDTGADASWYVDALSNGIKIRNNSNFDNGGNSFIYMAFAENPFKYSNAR